MTETESEQRYRTPQQCHSFSDNFGLKQSSSRVQSVLGLDFRSHVSPLTAVHKKTLNAFLTPWPFRCEDEQVMMQFLNSQHIRVPNFVGIIQLSVSKSGHEGRPAYLNLCEKGQGGNQHTPQSAKSPFSSRSPPQRTFFISAVDSEEKTAWLLEITHQFSIPTAGGKVLVSLALARFLPPSLPPSIPSIHLA